MISPKQAIELILSSTPLSQTYEKELAELPGETLAQEARADRDGPPFERVAMDGIASKLGKGLRKAYLIKGVQAAGAPPLELEKDEECFEVMTGAPLPIGCDFVLPYEKVEIKEGLAIPQSQAATPFQNIHRKGSDFLADDALLNPGDHLGGPEIAILASLGHARVKVYQAPSIALVSTGDELVEPHETPLPHQIRRSNIPAIMAMLRQRGFLKTEYFSIQDNLKQTSKKLEELLSSFDILIITGGVSKGKFDHVPEALNQLNVEKIFHGIRQKPGKPMFYGTYKAKQVFGLPGNPVSSLVCLRKYVLPALMHRRGERDNPLWVPARFSMSIKRPLTVFLPGRIVSDSEKGIGFIKQTTNGSGDFYSLKATEGFIEIEEKKNEIREGESYPFYNWR